MREVYPRTFIRFRPARTLKMRLLKKLLIPTLLLLIISITTTFAQTSGENQIYLSGQIVNNVNGAPIPGQPVYVESQSESNGGFNYYLAAVTDEFGFFYDTVSTSHIDGSLMIYTYDIHEDEYEKEEFFRFNWASEYHMVTSLAILDPSSPTDFQANFESQKDNITNDSLQLFFSDESIGEGIVSWYWDFGDGTGSVDKDPQHIYQDAGVYDVTLTVSTEPFHHDFRTSTILKKVKAGMREYYSFGGHAKAGYFPVDIGTAYLYKIEDTEFIPIDTTEFDTLGYYYFYQMIEGEYKVKTFPSKTSVNAGEYLPTYYGNTLFWTKAKTIELNDNSWEFDIDMMPNYQYSPGGGAIDGTVSLEGNKIPNVGNIEIILFNEADNCLTYIQSNEDGNFLFSGLEYGTYKVLAEVPGMYTYPSTITLNEETPTVEDITIVVYEEEIPHGIGSEIETNLNQLGDPYPNPVRDHTTIEFNLKQSSHVQIFVLNQAGQVAYNHANNFNTGNQAVQLNTAALPAGMYRIMILLGNEKHIKPFIKIN